MPRMPSKGFRIAWTVLVFLGWGLPLWAQEDVDAPRGEEHTGFFMRLNLVNVGGVSYCPRLRGRGRK